MSEEPTYTTMKRTKTGPGAKFAVAMAALLLGAASLKAAPAVITWGNADGTLNALTYGTRLSSANALNATSGAGTFSYEVIIAGQPNSAANNLLLNAGENYLIRASYTPSSAELAAGTTANTADRRLTINKVNLTLVPKTKGRGYGSVSTFGAGQAIWADINIAGSFVNGETVNTIGVITTHPQLGEKAGITANTAPQTVTDGIIFIVVPVAPNYAFNTDSKGVLNINPGALVLRADAATKVYGAAQPTFTGSYSLNGGAFTPVVSGATVTLVGTDQLTIEWRSGIVSTDPLKDAAQINSVTAKAIETGGTPSLGKYAVSIQNGVFTITKKNLTVTSVPASPSKFYGEPNPAFSLAYAGFENGETATTAGVFTTAPTLGTVAVTVDAGSPAIPIVTGSAPNYNLVLNPGVLVVNPRPITIRFNNKSRVFGTPNPTVFDYSVEPNVPAATTGNAFFGGLAGPRGFAPHHGTDVNNVVLNRSTADLLGTAAVIITIFPNGINDPQDRLIPVDINSAVGDYPIARSGTTGTFSANYAVNLMNGTLSVTKLLPTFTWTIAGGDLTFEHGTALGGTRLNATATPFTTTVTASTITYEANREGETPFAVTAATIFDAGVYTLTAVYTPGTTDSATHAIGRFQISGINVTKRTIKLKANDQVRAYNSDNTGLVLNRNGLAAAPVSGSFKAGDTIANIFFTTSGATFAKDFTKGDPTITPSAVQSSNAGDTYTLTPGGGNSPNYNITYDAGKLTITKLTPLAPTWTIATGKEIITYGTTLGSDQFTAVANTRAPVTPGTVNYKVGSTVVNSSTLLLAGTTELEAYFVPADAVNYNNSASTIRAITVNQKKATIKAPTGKTRVYGAAGPTGGKYVAPVDVNVQDLIGSDQITVEYFIATQGIDTTTPLYRAPVGTYALNAQITDPNNKLSNYELVLESGTFSVTQKEVQITVKADRKKEFLAAYVTLTPATDLDFAGFIDAQTYANVVAANIGVVDGGVTTTAAIIEVLKADNTVFVPDANTAVGDYRIKVTKALSRNYNYVANDGIYKVTKITPVLDITAVDLNALSTLGTPGLIFGEDIKVAKLGAATTAYLATRTAKTAAGAFLNSDATVVSTAHMTVPFNNNAGRLYITFQDGYDAAKGLFKAATGTTKNKLKVEFFPTDVNYSPAATVFEFNVDKRDVNVTVANATRVYGDFNPIFQVTYSSGEPNISADVKAATWIGSDLGNATSNEPASGVLTVQAIPAALGATLLAAAGQTFPITFPQAAEAANYRFAHVNGTLTINRRPMTVTTKMVQRPYLGANPAVVIDYNPANLLGGRGFAPGENEDNAVNSTDKVPFQKAQVNTAGLPSDDPSNPAPAGSYSVIVANAFGANYLIMHVPGTFIVTKAKPVLNWANPANITYGMPIGAAQQTATASFNGVTVAGTFLYAESGQVLNAGTRTLKATFTSSNSNVDNGEVTTTLAVNKANITATAVDSTAVFGAANPTFSLNYGPFTGPDSTIDSPPTVSTTRTPASPVGSYDLVVTGGVDDNYTIVPVNTGKLIVTPKAITITAKNVTRAYGSANPNLETTIEGLANGDDATALSTIVTSTTAVATSPVGEYPINVSGGTSANYSTTTVAGKLTVTKAPLTISVKNASRAYNTANATPEIEYVGFLGTDTAASLKTPAVATHTAIQASDAGTYDITVAGATSDNYEITFVKGTLTVNKADPAIVWANPADISFGTALSSAQLNSTSTVAGTMVYSPASGTVLNAGSAQDLMVTLTPTDTKNYNTASMTVKINVNKATPVITWPVPSAIVYGASLGSLQLNATANAAGTLSYTPGFGTILGAGSRTLTVTFVPSDAANYNETTANNTIIVDKATLTIVADSKSKQFNANLPELTSSISGLASGDTAAVVGAINLMTTATKTSPIGSYQISLSGALTAANYNISFVPGVLTVTKAVPDVTWAAIADIVVGTALSDTQLNASSPIAGIFAYVPAKGTVLPLGNGQKVEAIFIPGDAINYELVRVSNTINVTTPQAKPVNPADLNADGMSDVLFQHTDGFLAAWFMDGANLKAATLLTPETAGDARWEVVGYGDFNGDGKGDILFQYNGGSFNGALAIWYMNGTTLTAATLATPSNPGAGWTAVAVGDMNGDKKADILFQHSDGFLAVWYMDGTTQTGATLLNPIAPFGANGTVDTGWRAVALADLNGDKKLDVVFQYNGGSLDRTVAVWIMNGINQTSAALLEPSNPGAGWSVVGAADYNNDGKTDILLQHSSGLSGVWYLNGTTLTGASLLNPESPGVGWEIVGP